MNKTNDGNIRVQAVTKHMMGGASCYLGKREKRGRTKEKGMWGVRKAQLGRV